MMQGANLDITVDEKQNFIKFIYYRQIKKIFELIKTKKKIEKDHQKVPIKIDRPAVA